MGTQLHSYQPISAFATNIYTVDGTFGHSPLGRRMTIVKTGADSLLIHSAIRMQDKDLQALDRLGRVATLIVPNAFHTADAAFYKERYPAARLLVPENLTAKEQKNFKPDGLATQDQGAWSQEVHALQLRGTRSKEVVFFHKASRTLILTDLAFNFERGDFLGMAAVLMSLNKADRGFAPSRLSNAFFFQDKAALGQSLEAVMQWPFENVIVSHGRTIRGGGQIAFKKAFEYLLKS